MRQGGICHDRATYFSGEDELAALLLAVPASRMMFSQEGQIDVSKKSSKSDLARIDRMKDKDIDYSDIPPLDRSFFAKPLAAWPRKKSARPRGTRRKR